MNKILSPGEKIRQLRLDAGLKQEYLTGDGAISKSLISMLEKDRRSLTWEVAEIIATCLNKYYENLGRTITAAYLMETEKDVLRKEIQKDIKHLQKAINGYHTDVELIKNTLDKALRLVKKGNFQDEYVELKILKGDFHYKNYQYTDAIADYLDVIGLSMKKTDYDQIARMYILLGRTYQMQLMLDNAIVYYVKAIETAVINNTKNIDKIKVYSTFNQILCYAQLKRYDLVMSHIKLFKELKWEDPLYKVLYNRILLTEANTFRDFENYEKAKSIYEKLLGEAVKLDKETLFLLYENYGVLHRNRGLKTKALEYLKKAHNMKEEVDLNYMPALYLYQATCYNLGEEYDKVISLLENGLRLAEMVSKQHMVIELRFAFVEVALQLQDYDAALKQLEVVEELLKKHMVKPLLYDLNSFYASVYMGLGDLAKSQEYAVKLRQKNYFWD